MQYLVSVIFDNAGLATPDEDAQIDVFNDRLQAEGHWVFAGGLAAPSSATVVDNRGEEALVTDGPFLESKEYLAGFWVMEAADLDEALTQAHHEEWARVVASLTRRFGDLDIAEEAAAEAFATAVERWPADGVPPKPGAWLTTTASRKAIDRIRRESKRADKQKEAQLLRDDPPGLLGPIDDERLRLIFTCCHPALAMETRVALTLRMVAGLTVPEIARAFLVPETAMEKRITRAKAKIKVARIPYRVPSAEDLPARVCGVLAVL